jgi:rod shape-determining protein MreC
MNKKKLFGFILLIVLLFVGALKFSSPIQKPLIYFLNSIKSSYNNILDDMSDYLYIHFSQAKHIKELEQKVENYQQNILILNQLTSELKDIYKATNSKLSFNPKVELVRTISYEKFGDTNRIWLDVKDYNSSKIYGLVYNNFVAGIVVPKNDMPLALINKDPKSTYAVSIGKSKAPGIAYGNNDKYLYVTFIPAWYDIKEGDEVKTSGLDNIFFKGLKVGKVISISKSQGYQLAKIEPYFQLDSINYFYIIKALK